MDTCNVKLFKLNHFNKEHNKEYEPPLVRNETILFSRFGYHNYFKVNADWIFNEEEMLTLR